MNNEEIELMKNCVNCHYSNGNFYCYRNKVYCSNICHLDQHCEYWKLMTMKELWKSTEVSPNTQKK